MIPDFTLKVERQSWQVQLSQAFTQLDDLLAFLQIDPADLPLLENTPFPLRVPKPFAEKMRKGDPNDPLLRQVLPVKSENNPMVGYADDPLEERHANPVPGLLHKFEGRVLLITNPSCAVHCRYCFRRHFPYAENRQSRAQWQQALSYIEQHTNIEEVILSGGDPLNLKDELLQWFIKRIEAIPHITTIRLHTRTPIVIPQRITTNLAKILGQSRCRIVIVFHVNHPNELGDDLLPGLQLLRDQGITLLNQSVLLKGVNDDAQTLIDLSKRLFALHILPYYIHTLDKVNASAHFEIAEDQIPILLTSMHQQLPGYLVPKLVTEVAQYPYKKPFDLSFL